MTSCPYWKDHLMELHRVNYYQKEELNEQEKINEQLFRAVFVNDIEAVKQAIEDGADVNDIDGFGSTPLNWADHRGHTEIAELLKQHGGEE